MSFAIYKPDEGMRSDGQRLSVRICRRPEYSAHAGWQNEPAKQHRQCLLVSIRVVASLNINMPTISAHPVSYIKGEHATRRARLRA